MSISQYTKIVY